MTEEPLHVRKEPSEAPVSAPIRILAFGMDFVLLIFISMLIMLYLPKALGEQTANEFDNLTSRVAELFQQKQPDQRELDNVLRDLQFFQDKINYNLIVTLFFIFYFLQAELFWGGKSIGKATFFAQDQKQHGRTIDCHYFATNRDSFGHQRLVLQFRITRYRQPPLLSFEQAKEIAP